jgi:hypothetical protein
MTVRVLEAAQAETQKAIKYYNKQREGLGTEFSEEVAKTLQRIESYPDAWGLHSHGTRLCRMKRFPYGIIYKFGGDEIIVVAVMHLHRRPGYWKRRMGGLQ